MARSGYAIFGLLVILGYGYVGWRGVELMGSSHRQYVAGGLRGASHGGYRSFWYSGFHGGK
jgi:hypothetical protein